MGKETCCHPETALIERLCALRGHVGKKGEKRRRSQGPGSECQGMSVVLGYTTIALLCLDTHECSTMHATSLFELVQPVATAPSPPPTTCPSSNFPPSRPLSSPPSGTNSQDSRSTSSVSPMTPSPSPPRIPSVAPSEIAKPARTSH